MPEDLEKNQEFLVYRDRKTQETFELGERDVILTEKMAKTLEVKKGDTITVKGENGDKKELTITNVCEIIWSIIFMYLLKFTKKCLVHFQKQIIFTLR